jgi:hypothetical protein
MNFRMSQIARFAVFLLAVAAPAAAQNFRPPDAGSRPWTTAKIDFGPIYMSPTFELTGVGVDNNVFNDESFPKSDITGALGMRTLAGLHYGELLMLQVAQDNTYRYYRRYRSERSIDGTLNLTLELRSRFVRPWVRWERAKTSQRLGFEIDERAERKTPFADFGLDVNAAFRLGISGAARRNRVRFKDTEEYKGQNLSEALDQTNDAYQVFVRYQVTELSDLVFGSEYTRDRFEKSPDRDNDSYFYYAGLRIKTGAMFTGTATAGYRTQTHQKSNVANFKGPTADVDLAMTPSEAIKLQVQFNRDMSYSYLIEYPFITETGGGVTLTNRFSEHLDVVLSARGRWLKYDETTAGTKKPYTERTAVFGIGPGYFVGGGTGTRLGLLFERWQRQSPADGRSFHDNRISSNYRFSF